MNERLLGFAQNDHREQCALYEVIEPSGNYILARYSKVGLVKKYIRGEKYKIGKAPIVILEDYPYTAITDWLDDVLTFKYPVPIQVKMLQFYADNPDDLLTQAVIDVCVKSDCFCPLLWSPLCCIEFIYRDVVSKYRSWKAKPLSQRKCVQRAISALRQHISAEELGQLFARIQNAMQQADSISLIKYQG